MKELMPDFLSKIKFFCISEKKVQKSLLWQKMIVFEFGSNKYGYLGKGQDNAVNEPQIVSELCYQQIIDISYGSYQVLTLTKSGDCYMWGSNTNGELGNNTKVNENKPKLIITLIREKMVQIRCGSNRSVLLTENNELYVIGDDFHGKVGLKKLKNSIKFVSIASGGGHKLVLTESGIVYGLDLDNTGQLGNRQKSMTSKLTRIKLSYDIIIKNISCGSSHSLLLSTDEDIYAFGSNNFGQLGDKTGSDQLIAVKIKCSKNSKRSQSFITGAKTFRNRWENPGFN
jgi:alpha-tubulin suppressor-like RCC1 family protein